MQVHIPNKQQSRLDRSIVSRTMLHCIQAHGHCTLLLPRPITVAKHQPLKGRPLHGSIERDNDALHYAMASQYLKGFLSYKRNLTPFENFTWRLSSGPKVKPHLRLMRSNAIAVVSSFGSLKAGISSPSSLNSKTLCYESLREAKTPTHPKAVLRVETCGLGHILLKITYRHPHPLGLLM